VSSIYIVGRGPSVYDFDWAVVDGPIMAVSSGIYALPEGRKPEHFVTMDAPKFFMGELMADSEIAWQHDNGAKCWPFWADPDIVKHVLAGRAKPGHYRNVPIDILDYVPEKFREHVKLEFAKQPHIVGYQPNWGDFPNLKTWPMDRTLPPNFSPEGPFGLEDLCNSWFYAVQIAHRMGFRQLNFIGCDFKLPGYAKVLEKVVRWEELARGHGFAWLNLSPESALSDVMPTVTGVPA